MAWVTLRLASLDPTEIKRGLQDACELIERGRYFNDHTVFIAVIPRLLVQSDTKVRRWAYKLIALLRDERLLEALTDKFDSETDAENISWLVSAVFALLTDRDLEVWLRDKGEQFFGTYLELAARLYRRSTFLEDREQLGKREFDSDPMVRKWTSLLWGYRKEIPPRILGYNVATDLIGNLVADNHEESVEYSIWAHYQNPEGSAKRLILRPLHIKDRGPANVRRWLYRLLTKNIRSARAFRELVLSGMDDPSVDAREGLALGIGRLAPFGLDAEILDWFERTPDNNVRLALVDHLGKAAEDKRGYLNTLVSWYARSAADAALRRKIEAAASAAPELRRAIELTRNAATIPPSDVLSNFGCDLYLVGCSDVILVDARTKKGIGIGAEMMFASVKRIPVITWAPRNSHYRKDFIPDVFGEDIVNWTQSKFD
jgi:hypothetical protein